VFVLEPRSAWTPLVATHLGTGFSGLHNWQRRRSLDLRFLFSQRSFPRRKALLPSLKPFFGRCEPSLSGSSLRLLSRKPLPCSTHKHTPGFAGFVCNHCPQLMVDQACGRLAHGQPERLAIASPCRPQRTRRRNLDRLDTSMMIQLGKDPSVDTRQHTAT
jgi:hypothetical protein